MRRGLLVGLAVPGGLLLVAGCSAILGEKDLPDIADGATGAPDGTVTDGGAATEASEGAPSEGSSDAPPAAVCDGGATQCENGGVATCTPAGLWGSPVPCAQGSCMSGQCVGGCTPPASQCSGNAMQTCEDGGWGPPTACTGQTCVGGQCVGTCAPGATGCDGITPWTCDAGAQVPGSVGAGQCDAACVPDAAEPCSGPVPQTCNASGQLVAGTVTAGQCGAICTPNQTSCNGTVPQTCTSTGTWDAAAVMGGLCGAACTPGATHACNPAPACNPSTVTCNTGGQFPSCPTASNPTWNGLAVGASCTVGVGACASTATVTCSGTTAATCPATAGTPANGYRTTAAPNGSWDWNCDGTVEMEYAIGGAGCVTQNTSCGQTCSGESYSYAGSATGCGAAMGSSGCSTEQLSPTSCQCIMSGALGFNQGCE